MTPELCEEDRIAIRRERHRSWIQLGLRGLWRRRTHYKPGFNVCGCEICQATCQDAKERCCSELPRMGSAVTGCLYINREKVVFADRWRAEHEDRDLGQLLVARPLRPGERDLWFGHTTPIVFVLTYRERVICATIGCGYKIVRRDP